MALIVSPTYRNLTSANGRDHTGWLIVTWALALEASGFWRRKYQGDGVSVFSSGTTNIFTANVVGYKTSGAWGAAAGGANSITNSKAYIVMEEVVGGVATGRQAMIQRGSSTAVGEDRSVNLVFAWEPMTGSPAAATAPTAPTKSVVNGIINGAGIVLLRRLSTSPQMGGSGGTIVVNFWVCDRASGRTANVCPWAFEAYDGTADEVAIGAVYEALLDTPATCDHPCIVFFPNTSALAGWEFGEAKTDLSNMHGQGSSVVVKIIDPADNATVVNAAIDKFPAFSGTYPNSSVVSNPLVDVDSKFVKVPSLVHKFATGSTFMGVCETIESIPGDTAVWPHTFHASVADAVEPPRLSWTHTTMPWEVALPRTLLSSAADHTDVRRVLANAAVPDAVAPVIGAYSPAAGAIGYTQAITVPISDNLDELSHFIITAEFSGIPDETVWNGTAFSSDYSTSTGLTGGNVVILRDVGWPRAFTLRVRAWDEDGNDATASAAYTISTSPNPVDSSVAPTVASFNPATGASIAYDSTVTVDVTDNAGSSGIARYAVSVLLAGQPDEVVWDGSALSSDYDAASGTTPITNGFRFSLKRDAGFPAGFTLKVVAVDTNGNATVATASYTISSSPNPADPSVAPTVGSFNPASASSIAYDASVTVDVTDNAGAAAIARYMVSVLLAGQPDEVVWDGSAMSSDYDAASGTSAITNGFRFTLKRDMGFPGSFTLKVVAIDVNGNSTVATASYTISTTPNPAAPDTTAPIISLVTPDSLDGITRKTPITLELDDDRGIEYFVVFAIYPSLGEAELVVDGADLTLKTPYRIVPSTVGGKQRYEVLRRGGWPASGYLRARAIDARGNLV